MFGRVDVVEFKGVEVDGDFIILGDVWGECIIVVIFDEWDVFFVGVFIVILIVKVGLLEIICSCF